MEGRDRKDKEKIFKLVEMLSIPGERLVKKSYLEMLEECREGFSKKRRPG